MSTTSQKIAQIDAKVYELQQKKAELVAQLATEVNPAHVVAGAVVEFNQGRGEDKKTLTGTVLGVKAAEGKTGAMAKIASGEGFDATVYPVFIAAVTKIVSSPAIPAVEQDAE